jgi:hypothetical protein
MIPELFYVNKQKNQKICCSLKEGEIVSPSVFNVPMFIFQFVGADEKPACEGSSRCPTGCQVQVSQKMEGTGNFFILYF